MDQVQQEKKANKTVPGIELFLEKENRVHKKGQVSSEKG